MNVLSRWRASGVIHTWLGLCHSTTSTTGSATRSGIVLLQRRGLHPSKIAVCQTEVGFGSVDELVPSMGYHLFQEAQRLVRRPKAYQVCAIFGLPRPPSLSARARFSFFPLRVKNSSLGSNPIITQTLRDSDIPSASAYG